MEWGCLSSSLGVQTADLDLTKGVLNGKPNFYFQVSPVCR